MWFDDLIGWSARVFLLVWPLFAVYFTVKEIRGWFKK